MKTNGEWGPVVWGGGPGGASRECLRFLGFHTKQSFMKYGIGESGFLGCTPDSRAPNHRGPETNHFCPLKEPQHGGSLFPMQPMQRPSFAMGEVPGMRPWAQSHPGGLHIEAEGPRIASGMAGLLIFLENADVETVLCCAFF